MCKRQISQQHKQAGSLSHTGVHWSTQCKSVLQDRTTHAWTYDGRFVFLTGSCFAWKINFFLPFFLVDLTIFSSGTVTTGRGSLEENYANLVCLPLSFIYLLIVDVSQPAMPHWPGIVSRMVRECLFSSRGQASPFLPSPTAPLLFVCSSGPL